VINTGQPTYQHHSGSQSQLDVAIVSSDLAARARWSVLNNTMGSDHSPTIVTVDELETHVEYDSLPTFNMSRADWAKFKHYYIKRSFCWYKQ